MNLKFFDWDFNPSLSENEFLSADSLSEGEILCFLQFVWLRQSADGDCAISIEYNNVFRVSKSRIIDIEQFLTGTSGPLPVGPLRNGLNLS